MRWLFWIKNLGLVFTCILGGDVIARVDNEARYQADYLVFSRDDRPVDGLLRAVMLKKNQDLTYDATFRTAYYDRIAGRPVDKTEEIGQALTCSISIKLVFCSRDDRPADGALTEIRISRDARDQYTATLRTAYYNMLTGQSIDKTNELASHLRLLNPIP